MHDKQEIRNKNKKTCEGQKTSIRKSTGEKLKLILVSIKS